jgi:hypothetical protein
MCGQNRPLENGQPAPLSRSHVFGSDGRCTRLGCNFVG